MRARLTANPDAGARTVSDNVRTEQIELGAYALFTLFESGTSFWAGLGDGSVARCSLDLAGGLETGRVDIGALALCAAPDPAAGGILVGTDGGQVLALKGSDCVTLSRTRGRWVEQVACHPLSPYRAWVVGRDLVIADLNGDERHRLSDHPSTITGLAFSPDGQRLAAAHYDGVSVWRLECGTREQSLDWHGSHTAVTWSPDGGYIVTATQDRELHGWRLADGKSLKMSGYPAKIRGFSWTADSRYLAAAGADTVTSWCFDGGGPTGRPPLEFGYVFDGVVTQVAAHPQANVVAAGFDNGTVLIGSIEEGDAIIAAPPGSSPVTCVAWTPAGDCVVAGSEDGRLRAMHLNDPLLTRWGAGRRLN